MGCRKNAEGSGSSGVLPGQLSECPHPRQGCMLKAGQACSSLLGGTCTPQAGWLLLTCQGVGGCLEDTQIPKGSRRLISQSVLSVRPMS